MRCSHLAVEASTQMMLVTLRGARNDISDHSGGTGRANLLYGVRRTLRYNTENQTSR